jgi:rabenosyn-5
LEEAHKVRKRLLDLFTQYDAISKRILQSPSPSATDIRVQSAMNQAATHFLQTHMLPLQSLPKILKGKEKSSLNENHGGSESNEISDAKEKELKEKMMVLEEQKYLVENMIQRARKGRRMEEVEALKESIKDLDGEIEKIKEELGDLYIA